MYVVVSLNVANLEGHRLKQIAGANAKAYHAQAMTSNNNTTSTLYSSLLLLLHNFIAMSSPHCGSMERLMVCRTYGDLQGLCSKGWLLADQGKHRYTTKATAAS